MQISGKSSIGAYGLYLEGLAARDLIARVPDDLSWPHVEVRSLVGETTFRDSRADAHRAIIRMPDGDIALIERNESRATYFANDRRSDGRLLHPFLSIVGTVFASWLGRHAFHAGAFASPAGAWGVVGDREAGKSSILAALSAYGCAIVTDDLLVVRDDAALIGPRCIDLRPGVPAALGLQCDVGTVRGGERLRLPQGPGSAEAPLRGWIFLAWGPHLDIRPVGASERLRLLRAQTCIPGPASSSFVELVELPGWKLVRPRDWSLIENTVELLRDVCCP